MRVVFTIFAVALVLRADTCDDRLAQVGLPFAPQTPLSAKSWFCSSGFLNLLPNRSTPMSVRLRGQMVRYTSSPSVDSLEKRNRFCNGGSSFTLEDSVWLGLQVAPLSAAANWADCHTQAQDLHPAVRVELVENSRDTLFANVGLFGQTSGDTRVALVGTLGALTCPHVQLRNGLELVPDLLKTEKCSTTDEKEDGFLLLRIGSRWAISSRLRKIYGGFAGEGIVELVLPGESVGGKTSDHQTGDHHCSSNCGGDPTRTRYIFPLTADPETVLRNPRLQCVSGPCHGWNTVVALETTDQDRMVRAVVDVWSSPTTWRLAADVFRANDRDKDGETVILFWGKRFSITAPADAKAVRLRARLTTQDQFLINLMSPGEASPVVVRSVVPSGSDLIYDLELKNH
jgi:hypothetical protein